ncbi:hypothetical protein [Streptomyces sp. I05A-00742]|uniref:hypothetical protein n=1 Tax=Streptomyces sp. I05A-00742 TaxID=2732853 RepID=UPI002017448F|nr:hypothetical protein [Streptomyces sp. I05A-00742]
MLRRAVDGHGRTVVMVTHDPVAAATADRVVSWPTAGSWTTGPAVGGGVAARMTGLEAAAC